MFENLNSASYFVIRIQGHISDERAELFERMTIHREDDGTTTLTGFLPDQSALHSILMCIRDMNLKLISVNETETPSDDVLHG